MSTHELQNRIETGSTGWISIHINDSQSSIDLRSGSGERVQGEPPLFAPVLCRVFERVQQTQVSLPERFPRLTVLAIAVVLLASALTAEFDCLRGAGYYWP